MKHSLLGALVALLCVSCSPVADTNAAKEGVAEFHRAMDAGQHGAIYDASGEDLKSAIARDDFVAMLEGLRSKFGPYKSGKTVGWHDNVGTAGHYVSLNHEAQFQAGPGNEEFVFRMEKGKPVLAGYHVKSNLLATR